jgi:hypothetical protein
MSVKCKETKVSKIFDGAYGVQSIVMISHGSNAITLLELPAIIKKGNS